MNDQAALQRPHPAPATGKPLKLRDAGTQPPSAGGHPRRRVGDHALLESSAFEDLDRMTNATLAKFTLGLSPASMAMIYMDWLIHLWASPGKQAQLADKTFRKTLRFGEYVLRSSLDRKTEPCITPLSYDHRFDHPGWQRAPWNLISQGFLLTQQWWHNATTGIRGVGKRHEMALEFYSRQWLDMMAPCNLPWVNPEVLERTIDDRGMNLVRGAAHLAEDVRRNLRREPPAGAEAFKVGRDVAITPGKVVFRNHLIELIQYEPQTGTVQREPVLMLSAWMMKYYIMDLSPQNSMVRYLVENGHTVFMISWRNPGPEDRDLGMEDYRRAGLMAALDAVSEIVPGEKIHAVGYCLGGILLTIAAATMARDGDDRLAGISLFTTMVDFTEVGEMGVFMDESQVALMEDMMWEQGYLDHRQAAMTFRMLRSADLVWSKMVREYWLGDREPMFDLMAWNADGTRMPYRQHSELLRRLYRDNELFDGHYKVEGRAIRLSDIHRPIFSVAATRDHVAPWKSVYKLHLQSDAASLTFVLTSGGHNVGIVSEPGHPRRSFQMSTCRDGDRCLDPDTWAATTSRREGSWWPAWQTWLKEHSSGTTQARPVGSAAYPPVADAPGAYVLMT